MTDSPNEAPPRATRPTPQIHTDRLVLRGWQPGDRPRFVALNADPRVMEYFPARLTPAESEAALERIVAHFETHGFGAWVLEIPGVTAFAGVVGLSVPRFRAPFTPCVEVSWRLLAEHWGHGYATEAARAALRFGFTTAGLTEIVALTVPHNRRSRRVMEKLGMRHDPAEDFEHPFVPVGHPLRRHVLYRGRPADVGL